MAGTRELLAPHLLVEADVNQGLPGIADIAGGAPGVASHFGAPRADVVLAVLTKAEDDLPSGFEERLAHFGVGRLLGHGRAIVHGPAAAPVVLQVIDAPRGVLLGILRVMVDADRKSGA